MAREPQWCVGPYGTGYWMCTHTGCQKKVRDGVTDHACCGNVRHTTEHLYMERRRQERASGHTEAAEASSLQEAVVFGVFAGAILAGVKLLDFALGGRRRG